jgi:F-type H+-transporting ATPase subunit delta
MATHTDALAQIYATSVFELAQQAGGRDKIIEIGEELEQLCELTRSDRSLAEFLTSPIIDTDRRRDSLSKMFANRVTDLTLRFLLVLNQKGRLPHIESITAAYDQRVQKEFGRVEVDVYTPLAMDAAGLDAIAGQVKAAIGRDPVMHSYVDPEMIGGIKLRIGDQLIDGSVASQLRRLGEQLRSGGGESIRGHAPRFIEGGENVA